MFYTIGAVFANSSPLQTGNLYPKQLNLCSVSSRDGR